MWKWILSRPLHEPAVIFGAIVPVLSVLRMFHVLGWTAEQMAAVDGAVTALSAIVVRQLVTPTAKLQGGSP